MTGQVITAAIALAALLIAIPALRRATAALRLTCQHEEALRLAARETPLEAIVDATREPPWLTDEHVDRLIRLLRDDGEAL